MRKTQKRKGGYSKSRKNHTRKSNKSKPLSQVEASMHLDHLEDALSLQERNIRTNKPLFMTDVNYYAKTIGKSNLPVDYKRRVSVLRSMKTMHKSNK